MLLIPLLALALAACIPKSAPTVENGATVIIQNFAYTPNEIKIKAGQTVNFTNKDLVGHSLTSDDGTSFNTNVIGQNQSAAFTAPAKPGNYPFHCTPHPGIKGTLVVE